jgi:hypothetical protein
VGGDEETFQDGYGRISLSDSAQIMKRGRLILISYSPAVFWRIWIA